ncbi:MAG TPA: MFS transporter, partial [Rhodospirillaceae bacterium]|nr:MFS transporter [Rhodospirillaceae bacterium]
MQFVQGWRISVRFESVQPPTITPPRKTSPWALVALAVSMLLASLGINIANVALPAIAQAFDAPFHTVQWIVLAYLLTITIMIVTAGRLGDILGHKRVLTGGLILFTLASLLCGVSPTLPILIAARALQGVGAAVLMALSLALIRDTVPPEKIGTAMGLMGTMSAVGTALGPSLGGLLLAGPGWHAIFLIVVPLGLVNTVLVLRTIPAQDARVTDTRPRLDGWGTLFLAGALGSYALAVTIGNGTLNWLNIGLISASALAIGVFIRVEKTAPAPLIELSA